MLKIDNINTTTTSTSTSTSTHTQTQDVNRKLSKQVATTTDLCQSIRSTNESHLRCLLKVKPGKKYCPLHLTQKHIIDFIQREEEYTQYTDFNQEIIEQPINSPIYRQISLCQE